MTLKLLKHVPQSPVTPHMITYNLMYHMDMIQLPMDLIAMEIIHILLIHHMVPIQQMALQCTLKPITPMDTMATTPITRIHSIIIPTLITTVITMETTHRAIIMKLIHLVYAN
jgi:hypothetical protein